MNIKRIILMLTVSAALMLAFLPASIFAEGETAVPVTAHVYGDLQGVPGETEVKGLDIESTCLEVEFSDGSTSNFIYGTHTFKDENNNEYKESGFFLEGADPQDEASKAEVSVAEEKIKPFVKNTYNPVTFRAGVPYKDGDTVKYEMLEFSQQIWVSIDEPVAVEFEPADGFVLEGKVGYNYIDESAFYGEGNKFYVTIKTVTDATPAEGSYTAEYVYTKGKNKYGDEVEGFYDNGNPDYERFDISEGFDFVLSKGMNDIELEYVTDVPGLPEPVTLPFNVKIKAEKFDAYTDNPIYEYTGKAIKPKFIVYDSADEKVPASQYTFKMPKNKKIGWYDVEITFKDAYKDRFIEKTITATYGIGPKAPKITKVKGGKKCVTVYWKKFTKKQLKQISGASISISSDAENITDFREIKISKKELKSGKKVIKKLVKGRKYFVSMNTFKKIKQNGEKFNMYSNTSKEKSAKAK